MVIIDAPPPMSLSSSQAATADRFHLVASPSHIAKHCQTKTSKKSHVLSSDVVPHRMGPTMLSTSRTIRYEPSHPMLPLPQASSSLDAFSHHTDRGQHGLPANPIDIYEEKDGWEVGSGGEGHGFSSHQSGGVIGMFFIFVFSAPRFVLYLSHFSFREGTLILVSKILDPWLHRRGDFLKLVL